MHDGPASAGPSPFLDSSAVLVFAHAAAAAVLVVSFAALAAQWLQPRLERRRERRLFRLPVAVDALLGLLDELVLAVTVYAGLAGTSNERRYHVDR